MSSATDSRDKSAEQQTIDWERSKRPSAANREQGGVLDGVALGLPALTRAVKLQKRAARVGFDWPSTDQVLDKIIEESRELVEARDTLTRRRRGRRIWRFAVCYGKLGAAIFMSTPKPRYAPPMPNSPAAFNGSRHFLADAGQDPGRK